MWLLTKTVTVTVTVVTQFITTCPSNFPFFSKIYQALCSLPIDINLYFPSKLQQHNDYFDYNNCMSTLWVRFHGRESRGECRMNNLDPPEFKKMFKIMEKSF